MTNEETIKEFRKDIKDDDIDFHCSDCKKWVEDWIVSKRKAQRKDLDAKYKFGLRNLATLIKKETKKELYEKIEGMENALRLILPLAKGYVAKNDVGSNQKYIEKAERALEDIKKLIGG